MDIVYEEMDADAMTNSSMALSGTLAMHSLAYLREKLQKLMQAPQTSNNMEIDKEELKKHACILQMCANQASTPNTMIKGTAPEVKKSCNNETPPLQVKEKVLFLAQKASKKEDATMTEASGLEQVHNAKPKTVMTTEPTEEERQSSPPNSGVTTTTTTSLAPSKQMAKEVT